MVRSARSGVDLVFSLVFKNWNKLLPTRLPIPDSHSQSALLYSKLSPTLFPLPTRALATMCNEACCHPSLCGTIRRRRRQKNKGFICKEGPSVIGPGCRRLFGKAAVCDDMMRPRRTSQPSVCHRNNTDIHFAFAARRHSTMSSRAKLV